MNIIMLSSSFKMQIQFRRQFIIEILKRGHSIQLYSDIDLEHGEIKSKMHHFNSFSFNLFHLLSDLLKLRKIISRDVDFVFNYTIRNCLLSSILVIFKLNNCKNIFFVAGLGRSYEKKNFISSLIIQLISFAAGKNGNLVVVMNERDYNLFISKNIKPIKINSEGLDLTEFGFSPPKSNSDFFNIAFLGRIIPDKGIYDILKLAQHFEPNRNVKIELYGDITETPKDFLTQIKYYKNLHLMGYTNSPHKVIKEANLIILPSTLNEGLPRIMLECFALGRICVAYNIPGCSDVYLFTPYPNEFLANSLIGFIEKCEMAICLSNHTYKIIAEKLRASIVENHNVYNINTHLLDKLGI